jgi:replicative DNA helicase
MSSNQLMALVKDLHTKRNGFKPDFIVVDYLGLMIPNGKAFSDNTYGKLKTVAEELRAVAVKLNVPMFSAVQINRSGYEDSEIGLEKTSDSMGIPMTADIMIMVSRTEDMVQNNQLYWHIAKSRFSKNGSGFLVSVDYEHMRINDLLDANTIENKQERIKEDINKLKNSDPPKKSKKDIIKDVLDGTDDITDDMSP